MPQFAANLSFLYQDLPFMARFDAAARDGFGAVEYLFPYDYPAADIKARLADNGLQQVLFNAPPGDWAAGERGLACLAGRQAEFRGGMAQALDYAAALGCPRIHVMAGLLPAGQTRDALQSVYLNNLRWAAAAAAPYGVTLLIEPINLRDIPGYFLNRQDHAHELLQAADVPNLKVQMDLYHCQIVEGDVSMKLRQYLPTDRVGHIQIAGVPARHEPDEGELNYPHLFALLDALGYDGWVGCEYRPRLGAVPGATAAGLGWMAPWVRP